jgi:hypothetical protein
MQRAIFIVAILAILAGACTPGKGVARDTDTGNDTGTPADTDTGTGPPQDGGQDGGQDSGTDT